MNIFPVVDGYVRLEVVDYSNSEVFDVDECMAKSVFGNELNFSIFDYIKLTLKKCDEKLMVKNIEMFDLSDVKKVFVEGLDFLKNL